MIDRDLLLTIAAMAAVLAFVPRWVPTRAAHSGSVLDLLAPAVLAGVLAGRITTMVLDDPSGLTRLRDILTIRGGAELWPGVAVGALVAVLQARRAGFPTLPHLSDLAFYGLLAYATYEAACVLRGTCFGPASAFGLRPRGIATAQVPVGLLVGLAVVALALVVRHLGNRPVTALLVGALGLGAIRALAAVWLPRIGDGPSRQQVASALIAGGAALALAAPLAARRFRRGAATADPDTLS